MTLHTKTLLTAATACAALTTATASAAVIASWDGGTGNFADANWTVDGTPSQNHGLFTSAVYTTTINGGTVNNFNNALTGNIDGRMDSVGFDSITITGGAAVNGDFIVMQKTGAGGGEFSNAITLENGSMTFSNANVFRSDNTVFTGFINFTGAAGSAFVAQTDLTGTSGQRMANKIGAGTGNADSYFAIDGTMVASGVAYDGTNLAAVNDGLDDTVIAGRYFQIVESGGTQTLTLVPEPGSLALLGLGGLLVASRRRRD